MARRDPNRPPQFRGADFTMRWEQGRWSEDRLAESINATGEFVALPYGRSQIGPKDKADLDAYWRRFVEVEGDWKRPDLLVLPARTFKENEGAWAELLRDPTIRSDEELEPIVRTSLCGIEAENSLWVAEKMRDFNSTLPLTRLQIVAPRIWVKEEDSDALLQWTQKFDKLIFVVQVFYDRAYMIGLEKLLARVAQINGAADAREKRRLQKELGIIFQQQGYVDSRTGQASKKLVYTAHHTLGVCFGTVVEEPVAVPEVIKADNGKIMPYVRFRGGRLDMTDEALTVFRQQMPGTN